MEVDGNSVTTYFFQPDTNHVDQSDGMSQKETAARRSQYLYEQNCCVLRRLCNVYSMYKVIFHDNPQSEENGIYG
jgi:hypothetical protein